MDILLLFSVIWLALLVCYKQFLLALSNCFRNLCYPTSPSKVIQLLGVFKLVVFTHVLLSVDTQFCLLLSLDASGGKAGAQTDRALLHIKEVLLAYFDDSLCSVACAVRLVESFFSQPLHINLPDLILFIAVVEHAYQLGNATQKHTILMELYSTELQLFKDLVSMKERR